MVLCSRVIFRMPAKIISDNNEFIGETLSFPLLREKINTMSGNLTEHEVINLIESLLSEYNIIIDNKDKKTDFIAKNGIETWKSYKHNKHVLGRIVIKLNKLKQMNE